MRTMRCRIVWCTVMLASRSTNHRERKRKGKGCAASMKKILTGTRRSPSTWGNLFRSLVVISQISFPAVGSDADERGRTCRGRRRIGQPSEPSRYPAFGQVVLIQFTVAEGSSCPFPGLGHVGGAVMALTGTVMIRSGSHTGNG